MSDSENSVAVPWSRMVDPADDDEKRADYRKWLYSMPEDFLVDRVLYLEQELNHVLSENGELLMHEYATYALKYAKSEMEKLAPKSVKEISERIAVEMETPLVANVLRSAEKTGSRITRSVAARKGIANSAKAAQKSAAKSTIKEAWDIWQKALHQYVTQTEFANEMLKIHTDETGDPLISFDTIIKKWIPAWSKGK